MATENNSSYVTRAAKIEDFESLTPLMQASCERLQHKWENYEAAMKQILANPEYGFVLLSADESGAPVGFISFTFEWSDWRDGAFFWLQGLQVADNAQLEQVLASLRVGLDAHKASLDYTCCGIRLCSDKKSNSEVQDAISTFELTPSHYYIYHVDTVN